MQLKLWCKEIILWGLMTHLPKNSPMDTCYAKSLAPSSLSKGLSSPPPLPQPLSSAARWVSQSGLNLSHQSNFYTVLSKQSLHRPVTDSLCPPCDSPLSFFNFIVTWSFCIQWWLLPCVPLPHTPPPMSVGPPWCCQGTPCRHLFWSPRASGDSYVPSSASLPSKVKEAGRSWTRNPLGFNTKYGHLKWPNFPG